MNELSSALKRRFNTVGPAHARHGRRGGRDRPPPRRVDGPRPGDPRRAPRPGGDSPLVAIFRDLREGQTGDGKVKVKQPSGTMSTAEAISVVNQGLSLAAHFGDGVMRSADIASGLVGAVIKDPVQDRVVCSNIWRPWSRSARDGRTSTGRAGRSGDRLVELGDSR